MSEIFSDDYVSSQPSYDATFSSIHDWALARSVAKGVTSEIPTEYKSSAKNPVVPFAPLSREIGISPVDDIEIKEMSIERQKKISNWVGQVKSPFDLIQRAEGYETPIFVYYAGQKRAVKNIENGINNAITRSKAGRAAVRREYDTTFMHYEIAKDRANNAQISLEKLNKKEDLTRDDQVVFIEILQELANGLAANLDNKFPGSDLEAREAGNCILGVALGIERGVIDPLTQKRLLHAAVGYIRKQEKLWDSKLRTIFNFAAEKGFTVGENSKTVET